MEEQAKAKGYPGRKLRNNIDSVIFKKVSIFILLTPFNNIGQLIVQCEQKLRYAMLLEKFCSNCMG